MVRSADVQLLNTSLPCPSQRPQSVILDGHRLKRWGSVKSGSSRVNKRVWNRQASQLPTFSTVKCPEQNARPFVREQLSSAELHKLYSLAITGNFLGSSCVIKKKKDVTMPISVLVQSQSVSQRFFTCIC